MEDTKAKAINTLFAVLAVTKEASGSFPPLQAVSGGLLAIGQMLQKTSANADDIETLAQYIQTLNTVLKDSMPSNYTSCPNALKERIDRLHRDVDGVEKNIRSIKRRRFIVQVIGSDEISGKIQELVRGLSWTINNFNVGSMISIELAVDELRGYVQEEFQGMHGRFDEIRGQMSDGFSRILNEQERKNEMGEEYVPIPRYAVSARFDYHSNRETCEKETRMETLATIYHWIKPGDSRITRRTHNVIQEATEKRVFWLSGLAGTGKSTIAQTVAEWCDVDKYVGATFFCSRDSNDCSNIQLIFPTIAYQLGIHRPRFRDEVAKVLRGDRDVQESAVSRQLLKLIVEPLRAVKVEDTFPACVVIIDALDECKDDDTTSVILRALSHYIVDLDPLKFLITSRPVQNVRGGFRIPGLLDNTQHLVLNEIPDEIMDRDIKRYFEVRLASVAEYFHLHGSWPPEGETAALILQAHHLFIFAATAVKFIHDIRMSDPQKQLTTLLQSQTPTSSISPFNSLDILYMQVLRTAFPDIDRPLKARLKTVLGSIVLIRDRLSTTALETLLRLERGTVRKTLQQLHSLLVVPENDEHVIRLIHPSFHDFLIDRSRCRSSDFVVNSRIQHTVLSENCLKALQTLHRDMCQINDFSKLNIEVPDLSARIARFIPPDLQYACRHWAFHVSNAEIDNNVLDLLSEFCTDRLLNWLEVLSLLGDLGSAMEALASVRHALQATPASISDVVNLLHDCERIAREFFPALSVAGLQAYSCVTLFCPVDSRFHKQYRGQTRSVAALRSGMQRDWSPCINTMEGHFGYTTSVNFSPDGQRLVSGSEDCHVLLWDVRTGSQRHDLVGHSRAVNCVVFSPDGREVLSASSDKSIIIWDTITGTSLNTLHGHKEGVQTIAYSPCEDLIASGSDDGTVMLWDMSSNPYSSRALGTHQAMVSCVVYSRVGSLLVSGSHDNFCFLWDIQKRTFVRSFGPGHYQVFSVAISHDDKIIASGHVDNIIVLWNTDDGSRLRELKGHTATIWSVDFSLDSKVLASASWDHTIGLWSVASGAQIGTLLGHPDQVRSAHFSPDGTTICSGSCDHTVRVWQWRSGLKAPPKRQNFLRHAPWIGRLRRRNDDEVIRTWNETTGAWIGSGDQHNSVVRAIAFSPDGALLATGSWDGTIGLWNASSGTRLGTLTGHTDLICHVSFSASGIMLASAGHGDHLGRLWNVRTRKCMKVLKGHRQAVWMYVLTHDQKNLISCSDDRTVRIWDATNTPSRGSDDTSVIHESSGPVYAIALSSDDGYLAVGSLDLISTTENRGWPTMRLMDMKNRAIVWMTRVPGTGISSFAFSSDDTQLVSGCEDGTICLWSMPTTSLVGSAQSASSDRVDPLETFESGHLLQFVRYYSDHKAIITESCHTAIPMEHWPTCVTSPSARQGKVGSTPSFILIDGWIWMAAPERRRICWVPVEYRNVQTRDKLYRGNMDVFDTKVALGTENGRVVIIDFRESMGGLGV